MSLTRAQFCSTIEGLRAQSLSALNASTLRKVGLSDLGDLVGFANDILPPPRPLPLPKDLAATAAAASALYNEINATCPGILPAFPAGVAEAAEAVQAIQRVLDATSSVGSLATLASNALTRLTSLDDRLGTLIDSVRKVSNLSVGGLKASIPGAAGKLASTAVDALKKELLAVGGTLVAQTLNVNQLALARCAGRLCNSPTATNAVSQAVGSVRNAVSSAAT